LFFELLNLTQSALLSQRTHPRWVEIGLLAVGFVVGLMGAIAFFASPLRYIGLELILGLLIALEFVEKVFEIRATSASWLGRLSYLFSRPATVPDLAMLPLFIILVLIQSEWLADTRPDGLDDYETQDDAPETFVNLAPAMLASDALRYYCSIFVLVLWFRALDFLMLAKVTGVFVIALSRLLTDALKFGLLFFVVLIGFSVSFTLAFSEVPGFQSFGRALTSLLDKGLVGELDFDELNESHRALGPLLFTFFIVSCVFVLLTLLVALFNRSYELIQANAHRAWTLAWSQQLVVFEARTFRTVDEAQACREWISFITKRDDDEEPLFSGQEAAPITTPRQSRSGDRSNAGDHLSSHGDTTDDDDDGDGNRSSNETALSVHGDTTTTTDSSEDDTGSSEMGSRSDSS
jgi:Polycystin cation channel